MHSRLDRVQNWPALAKGVRYSVTALARKCGVTRRHLERYFRIKHGVSPHQWLHELRMKRALELVRDGTPLKEVAIELCYKDGTVHFTHDFTKYFGVSPGQLSSQPV